MPPHQPAGIAKPAVYVRSPQRRYHKGDVRCVPRFLMEVPPAARGRDPLDPRLPWHVGFELWTSAPARTRVRAPAPSLVDRPPSSECTQSSMAWTIPARSASRGQAPQNSTQVHWPPHLCSHARGGEAIVVSRPWEVAAAFDRIRDRNDRRSRLQRHRRDRHEQRPRLGRNQLQPRRRSEQRSARLQRGVTRRTVAAASFTPSSGRAGTEIRRIVHGRHPGIKQDRSGGGGERPSPAPR